MTEAARILIIEDNLGIQKSLRDALVLAGRTVIAVDNGMLALAVVEREPVALIFLDMKMPDMDGWAFAREYRARISDPAPIIVVTAARDAEQWAAEVDAVAYLAKPFELDDLLDLVDRHLRQKVPANGPHGRRLAPDGLGCWGVTARSDALLVAAEQALKAGDWRTAKGLYEAALEHDESPEALVGLGNALWWLQETEASLRYRERAYAAFRRRPDPFRAAVVALQLAPHYGGSLGNDTAARGWLGRAASLVEEFDLRQLDGWVLLGRAALANASGHPLAAEPLARDALAFARRVTDADLQLCALSQLGGALVLMGRVDEGAALLDEAMAGALGGEGEPETVVHTSCVNIICSSRVAEVKRAIQWIRAADEFNRRFGSPHLDAICRIAYGDVLVATGRWSEAESELQSALDHMSHRAEPLVRTQALAKFAELRLAQGRIEDAARLLEGIEDHVACISVYASLSVARGELEVAASVLRRRLRDIDERCLESAALLELLVEVELGERNLAAAMSVARRLAAMGTASKCDIIVARGERAHGRALASAGEMHDATLHFERATAAFARLELPLETARTIMHLARATCDHERAAAIAQARRALATFESLGAVRDADGAAAFLRELGVQARRSASRGGGGLTRREREVLALLGEGLSNRQIAERLCLTRKTVENHVASVLAKLNLNGRAEATAYVLRHSGSRAG